ncbi:MAG: FAD-dependent oxidoreductase [Chlamydiota bacterium]
MSRIIKSISAILLCSFALSASEPQVVKLTPPKITSETLSEKIVCTRPMREGKFNISLEQNLNKTIVNCYGHGGSGWTTLFGSVDRAIELFEQTNPNKETPIRIIGSGCMGLTTAVELSRRGYQVAGIVAKSLYDIPSWRAAGYFALVSVKTSPEEQEALNQIGLNTFLTYQTIDQGNHPYITKDAANLMPVYCSVDTDAGVEDLEARGMIPPREYVSLDFGSGVIHPNYVKFMTYFMNTTTLMHQLTAEVKKMGIDVELKEIASFNEIEEGVIFNCSGLGGKELNSDEDMIPVRGHLVTLNEASGSEHMDYMIYTKVKQDGKEAYIYMFPKNASVTPANTAGISCVGVLGGTFIPNADKLSISDQATLDEVEFQKLLDRNSEFFQGHTFNN